MITTGKARQTRGRLAHLGVWLSSMALVLGAFAAFGSTAAQAQVPSSQVSGQVSPTPNPTDSSGNTISPPTSTDNGTVSPGSGSGSGTGTNSGSGTSGSGGSLASTGASILEGILAAVLLVLLGTTLTLAARQRRHTV
ncbi:MAG: hypothetical protein M3Y91_17205 [Actinomycetota bacterium]|nr:hypothetical protein [Actinomycetota bacterium]